MRARGASAGAGGAVPGTIVPALAVPAPGGAPDPLIPLNFPSARRVQIAHIMTRSKTFSALLGASLLLLAAPALAASDIRVTIPAPAAQHVYDLTEYDVVVANIGNQSASSVVLTITLPATGTSPYVHVMGTLANVDSRCTKSGTKLTCNLGTLGKNKSAVVGFDIALPQASGPLSISAAATTTSNENSQANNSASDTPSLLNYEVSVSDGAQAHNRHCTGTGLTSFFECELYPSSLQSHDIMFHGDGTLSFVDAPEDGYSGVWWQDSPDSLSFTYLYGEEVVAEFHGYGTNPDCFEGITTFPGSAYNAPYEVCLL